MQANVKGYAGASGGSISYDQFLLSDENGTDSKLTALFSDYTTTACKESHVRRSVSDTPILSKPCESKNNKKVRFAEPVITFSKEPSEETLYHDMVSADDIDFATISCSGLLEPPGLKRFAYETANKIIITYCKPSMNFEEICCQLSRLIRDDKAIDKKVILPENYLLHKSTICFLIANFIGRFVNEKSEEAIRETQELNRNRKKLNCSEQQQYIKSKLAAFRSYLETLTKEQKMELSLVDSKNEEAMTGVTKKHWALAGHEIILLNDDKKLYHQVKKIMSVCCVQLSAWSETLN